MTDYFKSYLEDIEPDLETLPFTHCTDAFRFRSVLERDSLNTSHCPVFNKSIVYMFYGKPSYRVSPRAENRSDLMMLPVCFVLKPSIRTKSFYPFDTGAFANRKFTKFIHQDMELTDFYLGNSLDQPKKLIRLFFGSNRKYYFGEPAPRSRMRFSHMEVRSYYDLLAATGATLHDDRRSAIEIQVDASVSISTNVLAVVLPAAAMEDTRVASVFGDKWKATPLTYPTYYGTRPIDYHISIRDRILKFLEIEGYMHDT